MDIFIILTFLILELIYILLISLINVYSFYDRHAFLVKCIAKLGIIMSRPMSSFLFQIVHFYCVEMTLLCAIFVVLQCY